MKCGPPWSGFPVPPLIWPASWLPISEHLLCASYLTHMFSCYPHDNPMRQGFSPSTLTSEETEAHVPTVTRQISGRTGFTLQSQAF